MSDNANKMGSDIFLLTPLREGRRRCGCIRTFPLNFYSRPCGRGDGIIAECEEQGIQFLLTPLREGRLKLRLSLMLKLNFYSRPCGRGDQRAERTGCY